MPRKKRKRFPNPYDVRNLGIGYFDHPTTLMRVPVEQLPNHARLPHGYFTFLDEGWNERMGFGYVAGNDAHTDLVLRPRGLEKYNHDFFIPTIGVNLATACRQMFPDNSDVSIVLSVLYPFTEEYGNTIGTDISALLKDMIFIDEVSKTKIHIAAVKTMYETMGGIYCWELTHGNEDAKLISVCDIGGGTTEIALWDRRERRIVGKLGRADFGINNLLGELGRVLRDESRPGGALPDTAFVSLPSPAEVEAVLQGLVELDGLDSIVEEFKQSVMERIHTIIQMTGVNIGIARRVVTIGGGGNLLGSVVAAATRKNSFAHAYEPDANMNIYSNMLGGLYGVMSIAKEMRCDAAISFDGGNSRTKVGYIKVENDD